MSHSSRLADRLRRKTGEEMYNELKNVFDEDPMSFFGGWNSPHNSQSFSRAGFPFDEEVYPRRQDIRSHLDDLAQRHPEFADQLRGPPWGSEIGSSSHGTWGRKRRGSGEEEGQSPQACGSGETRPSQASEESTIPRGRPRQGPIPQYGLRNTVDLGQQQAQGMNDQEDRDGSRGQRSWSAPPDNRTAGAEQQAPPQPQQRFVSRINITPSSPGKPPPAPQKQPQQTPSNVRHIPIFVEGRDEPLLPKHTEEPEQIFSQRIPPQPQPAYGYSQPQTFTTHHIPVQRQPPAHQQQQQHQQQHHHQPPKSSQQAKPQPVFTEAKGVQEERIPAQKIPVQQQQKQHEQVPLNDPINKVQMVQKDVENLQQIVEKYSGNTRQDKEYVYLDEMLTRNLLKLDDIDTEGKENVRQARKDVIKNIQRCISILESKVPLPEDQSKAASDPDAQMADSEAQLNPETERVPDEVPEKMEEDEVKGELDVDMKEGSTNVAENVSTDANPEEKMEISQLSGVELVTASTEPVNMESEAVQNENSTAENNDLKDNTNAPCEQPTENVSSNPENPVVEVSDSLSEVPVNDAGDSAPPVVESSDSLVVSEGGDKEQLKVEADPKKKKTGKKSKSPVKKSAKVTESKQENEVEKG